MTYFTRLTKKDFSDKRRAHDAKSGAAMSDGSFPIESAKDMHNAIGLMGMSHHPESEVKAHIKARAAALGITSQLPSDW